MTPQTSRTQWKCEACNNTTMEVSNVQKNGLITKLQIHYWKKLGPKQKLLFAHVVLVAQFLSN